MGELVSIVSVIAKLCVIFAKVCLKLYHTPHSASWHQAAAHLVPLDAVDRVPLGIVLAAEAGRGPAQPEGGHRHPGEEQRLQPGHQPRHQQCRHHPHAVYHCTVLYFTVLYCTVLCCTVL